MLEKLNRKEAGFTIVEVMIVLAIAGLVLAIVFIAVPALQRNSRDSQRRADISALQSAVATYVGNNDGQVPTTANELVEAATSIDFGFYTAVPLSATGESWEVTTPATCIDSTSASLTGTALNNQADCTTAAGANTPAIWTAATTAATQENHIYFANMGASQPVVQSGNTEVEDFALVIEGAVCVGTPAKTALFPAVASSTNGIIGGGQSRSYAIVYAIESDPNWVCIDNV